MNKEKKIVTDNNWVLVVGGQLPDIKSQESLDKRAKRRKKYSIKDEE